MGEQLTLSEEDISEVTKSGQIKRIVEYCDIHGGITQYEAIKSISVMRLASRICDMKKRGYNIADEWVTGTNKYGEKYRAKRYRIVGGVY